MSKLLKVSTRGQVSLGNLAQYELYTATLGPNGEIILTPVRTVPVK